MPPCRLNMEFQGQRVSSYASCDHIIQSGEWRNKKERQEKENKRTETWLCCGVVASTRFQARAAIGHLGVAECGRGTERHASVMSFLGLLPCGRQCQVECLAPRLRARGGREAPEAPSHRTRSQPVLRLVRLQKAGEQG
jgi:hypothetical protein